MLSVRLKVDFSSMVVASKTFVFRVDETIINREAKASTSAGSLADDRPAYRGPSLCQCWGRWTQEAEPLVKVMSVSWSTEVPEH